MTGNPLYSAYYLITGETLYGSPRAVAVVLLDTYGEKVQPLQNVSDEGGGTMNVDQMILVLTLIADTISTIIQIIEYTEKTKINRPSNKLQRLISSKSRTTVIR